MRETRDLIDLPTRLRGGKSIKITCFPKALNVVEHSHKGSKPFRARKYDKSLIYLDNFDKNWPVRGDRCAHSVDVATQAHCDVTISEHK